MQKKKEELKQLSSYKVFIRDKDTWDLTQLIISPDPYCRFNDLDLDLLSFLPCTQMAHNILTICPYDFNQIIFRMSYWFYRAENILVSLFEKYDAIQHQSYQ